MRIVRLLKIVNGEVDYKAQSLQLASAPILLEGQEKGDYTVHLKPEITIGAFGFNVTHEDPAKRVPILTVRVASDCAASRGRPSLTPASARASRIRNT